MKKSLALLLVVLVSGIPAFGFEYSPTQTPSKAHRSGPVQISPKLIDSVLADEAIAKGVDLMVVSDNGQQLESAIGNLSDPLKGDLAQATKKYILSHAAVFNIPATKNDNLLKLVKQTEAAGGNHFFYQMDIEGVAVHEAVIDIHVGKDRRVQLTNGSFPTIKEIKNQITLGRIEAIAAATRAAGIKSARGSAKAELVVYPVDGNAVMAYRVRISSKNPLGDFDVLIDAETGKEISVLNQLVFAGETHEGKGGVYLHSPLKGSATVEILPHLTSTALEGLYANAVNEDGPGSVSTDSEHIYDPDNTHFDEAMIYYHITKIHDYHKALGNPHMDHSMKATVHVGDKYDNAYYSPWEDAMSFGDGNKFNDLAKEDVVAYHEYSHAALNPIVQLNYSKESGAMNEGQADYFACSFTNNPKLGEYVVAKMGKDCLRNLENALHYPEDIQGEVHADGKIWGAALWALRTALTAPVSDKIIQGGFSYLKPGSPKFSQGMTAIIAADKNLFDGKNKDVILEVFKKRGITTSGNIVDGQDLNRMRTFRTIHGN